MVKLREEEREATGFDLEVAEVRSCGKDDWVMVGCSSCGGLLDRRWSRSLLDRR